MDNLITKKEQAIFKEFLKTTDYDLVSKSTGYSVSTVCNILARKTSLNKRTQCVLISMRKIAKKNMLGISKRIDAYLLPAVDGKL
ncbi:hypothetical protein OAB94_01845 [Flavobacteriaceae bacterium]|nr:hypothetical protein [Flavobacteriaceae bacterium]MDB9980479.1 hypothetical protein [bacterium]